MKNNVHPIAVLIALSAAIGRPPLAGADDVEPPKQIVLHPAAAPVPALRHSLLPGFLERIDGNAIVYVGQVKAEQNAFFSSRELRENIDDRWQTEPLEKLKDVPQFLTSRDSGPLYYLDQAARCTHADWQLPLGREPYYSMLLPGVQESRQFARILAAHARIEMAHGNLDSALQDFRTGYALGKHVASNETLVGGLVGLAITNLMAEQTLEFIQQPGAPSLYWSLTELPRPAIDFREALEAEMHAVELSFPEVRDLIADRTSDQWRAAWFQLAEHVAEFSDSPSWKTSPAMLVASSVRAYPQAKSALVAAGASPEAVNAMSVAQVLMLREMQLFREVRDDAAKWFSLPYPEAAAGLQAAERTEQRLWSEGQAVLPLSRIFLPALASCRSAQVRTDRRIAALRLLEALRLYAGSHEGRLPESLSQIKDVPVPLDPVTERPFEYRLEGDAAHLLGPKVSAETLHYEIKMQRR
jgi:hypothetical protein